MTKFYIFSLLVQIKDIKEKKDNSLKLASKSSLKSYESSQILFGQFGLS